MLNREIPFLRIVVPLCLGILAVRYFTPENLVPELLTVIAILLFLISLFFNKGQTNIVFGFALSIALFITGVLIYSIEKSSLSSLRPVTADFLGTVSQYPEEKGERCRIIMKLNSIQSGETCKPLKGSILLNMKKSPAVTSLLPGDLLKVRCRPAPISNRGNPCEFDYRFYMENHGVKYTAFADERDILYLLSPVRRRFTHRALIIREKIIHMYEQRGISGERLALIAAVTLGQKTLLEPEQKQDFIKAGIMHIMAVSGLHAVILSMFVFSLLFFLKGKLTIVRISVTVLFLWLFAFVTGLTPSVMRATIMFTFIQSGKIMNRNVNNVNSVLASAFVLLIARPSVLFDAGFLLSYAAVIFIICFYNHLYNVFDLRYWLTDKIWQSAALTLVAQLGTLSLTISLFNRFPVYFMLTNIVIVPVSSLLIITGCLIPLTFPLKFISQPLASILDLLAGITGDLTKRAASLPFSSIDNIGLGPVESVLLFAFIFLLLEHIFNRQSILLHYPLLALLLVSAAVTIREISHKRSNELIVYNSAGQYTVGVRRGKTLELYTDNPELPAEVLRHCAIKNLSLKPEFKVGATLALNAGGNRILITRNLNNEILSKTAPDILILSGNDFAAYNHRLSGSHFRSVIITAGSMPKTTSPSGITADTVHYIKKSGAYRVKL